MPLHLRHLPANRLRSAGDLREQSVLTALPPAFLFSPPCRTLTHLVATGGTTSFFSSKVAIDKIIICSKEPKLHQPLEGEERKGGLYIMGVFRGLRSILWLLAGLALACVGIGISALALANGHSPFLVQGMNESWAVVAAFSPTLFGALAVVACRRAFLV